MDMWVACDLAVGDGGCAVDSALEKVFASFPRVRSVRRREVCLEEAFA